ncbi:hypothetical protein [Kitasatospora sp. NPDC088134]|uniref:hypothetical protein n=1 Tax=Kitasatospora sp. NPDC088134 TaxID=3364071 RepID=UPI00382A64AE
MTVGRPARRVVLVGFLVSCVVFTAVVAVLGVVAVTRGRAGGDAVGVERMAGLSHEQHPGKGRYYVPDEAALVPGDGQRQVFVVRSEGGPLPGAGDVYVRAEE